MIAARLLNILLLTSFLLASCVPSTEEDTEIRESLDNSFVIGEGAQTEPPAPSCYKDVYEPPKESITRKLDILIVPDTSASIKEERKRIAEGFDYFVEALPSGVDFNIGVILGHSENSNKSGKLYKKNSKDPLVLKSSELDLSKIKEALSLKIHKPKTDGYSDGGEMGLASLLNALKGSNLKALKDNGLLREDAALAVIFVADEQDICAKAPQGITFKEDPQNGERKSFVKYCIEESLKWKDATIGGDYTYKISPQIVLNRLKEIKGEMPLIVGGVLYDEESIIPTGNEDEIGYGYLETIRLGNGINVDLASGDYRDGLNRLGKLATSSLEAEQSFNLSIIPEISSIKTFVEGDLAPHTYDQELNQVTLVNIRENLETVIVEYCEKESTALSMTLGFDNGTRFNEENILLPISVTGENTLTTISVNGGEVFSSDQFTFEAPINLVRGTNSILVTLKNSQTGESISESLELILNSAPLALLSATPLEGTAPLVVTFDGSASSDDFLISSYELLVEEKSLSSTNGLFLYTFETAGTFEATLKVTDNDGLVSSKSLTIVVNPAPIAPTANFTLSKTSERAPSSVTIDASNSSDPDSQIVSYSLNYKGEIFSQSTPIFEFSLEEGGDYSFSLTVTDSQGLSNTKEGSFSLLAPFVAPIANFEVTPETGRVPLDVTIDASLSSDSDGSILKYDLYIDEILISQTNPIFNFNVTEAKSYNLRLVVTDNDGLTSEQTLVLSYLPPLNEPLASLSATPSEGEVPFDITLDASGSTDSDGEIVRYVFSDGQNVVESSSPTLTFTQETPGTYTYTVEVTDNDGLKSTASASVIANPKVTPEESSLVSFFKYNMIPTGGDTYNLELIFEGRSLNEKLITNAYYSTPEGIRVDVGRSVLGHIDVIPITYGQFDSPIEISLTIGDELGGNDVFTQTINANNPSPLLFVDAIEYAPNNIVLFSNKFHDPYNQLDGFSHFQIDFGDGEVLDHQDSSFQLTHAYSASGNYNVTITAFGNNGESFAVTESLLIEGETSPISFPLADFKVEKAPWAPGVRLYVDQSLSPNAPIMTYLWELGDGTTAYGEEVIHFYQAGGYDVTLTAILEDGSQSVVKREVIIMNDAPNIVSNLECWDIGNLTLECEMEAADKFNDLTAFNIHFGNSEILPENIVSQSVTGSYEVISFTHTYAQSGNYEVNYQILTGRGEELLKAKSFDVSDTPGNLAPVASISCFTSNLFVDCNAFSSLDPDGVIVDYEFSMGNGQTFSSEQVFYEYPESGTYDIILTVTDNFGLKSTDRVTVDTTVDPLSLPVAVASCSSDGLTVTCNGNNSYNPLGGSLTYEWSANGVFLSNDSSFQFDVPETGTYLVLLTVTNEEGINDSIEVEVDASTNSEDLIFAELNCQKLSLTEGSCNTVGTAGFNLIYKWYFNNVLVSELPENQFFSLSGENDVVRLEVSNGVFNKVFEHVFSNNETPVGIANFTYQLQDDGVVLLNAKDSFVDGLAVSNLSWFVDSVPVSDNQTYPFLELYGPDIVGKFVELIVTYEDGSVSSYAKIVNINLSSFFPNVTIRHTQPKGNASKVVHFSFQTETPLSNVSYEWVYNGTTIPNSLNSESIFYEFASRGEKVVSLVLNNGFETKKIDYSFLVEEVDYTRLLQPTYDLGERIYLSISNLDLEGIEGFAEYDGQKIPLANLSESSTMILFAIPLDESSTLGGKNVKLTIDSSVYDLSFSINTPVYSSNPREEVSNHFTVLRQRYESTLSQLGIDELTVSNILSRFDQNFASLVSDPGVEENLEIFEFLLRNTLKDLFTEIVPLTVDNALGKKNIFGQDILNLIIPNANAVDYDQNLADGKQCYDYFTFLNTNRSNLKKRSILAGAILFPATTVLGAIIAGPLALSIVALTPAITSVIRSLIEAENYNSIKNAIKLCARIYVPYDDQQEASIDTFLLPTKEGIPIIKRGDFPKVSVSSRFGQLFNVNINKEGDLKRIFDKSHKVVGIDYSEGTLTVSISMVDALIEIITKGGNPYVYIITVLNFIRDMYQQHKDEGNLKKYSESISDQYSNSAEVILFKNFELESVGNIPQVSISPDSNTLELKGSGDINRANIAFLFPTVLSKDITPATGTPFLVEVINPCEGERVFPLKGTDGLVSSAVRLSGNVIVDGSSAVCGKTQLVGPNSREKSIEIRHNSIITDSTIKGEVRVDNSSVSNSIVEDCSQIARSEVSLNSFIKGASLYNTNFVQSIAETKNAPALVDVGCGRVSVGIKSFNNSEAVYDFNSPPNPYTSGQTSVSGNGEIVRTKLINSVISSDIGDPFYKISLSGSPFGGAYNIVASSIFPTGGLLMQGSPLLQESVLTTRGNGLSVLSGLRAINSSISGGGELGSLTIEASTLSSERLYIGSGSSIKNSNIGSFGTVSGTVTSDNCSVTGSLMVENVICSSSRLRGNKIQSVNSSSSGIITSGDIFNGNFSNSEISSSGNVTGTIINSTARVGSYSGTIRNLSNEFCTFIDGNFECSPVE